MYDDTSLSPNPVNAMYVEADGTLWVGTVEGGLNRKESGDRSQEFVHLTKENSALSHNSVSALVADGKGRLWTGTWGGGLNVVELASQAVRKVDMSEDAARLTNFIGALAYDPYNDALWIGSNDGIFLYDVKTGELLEPFDGCDLIRGCIVASKEKRDNWNAIDPNFVIDDQDQPWLVWGSFWDGIQLVRLDTAMHVVEGEKPRTIARRYNLDSQDAKASLPINPNPPKNPTSDYAGPNAIEAPFIFKHDGWYYLFVSWDYCCQGSKSNYRVAVGRSKTVDGPYLDSKGIDMRYGGGNLFLEGDKKEYEAAGHCAAYTFEGQDIFICHGYSVAQNGASVLVQRPIRWTSDGWPTL